jgi:hypothetical protein
MARDDKFSFVVHLPQVSPVRLEHLPLFFDPISDWSKDDEEAHEENSPFPAQGWAGWASVLSPDLVPETPSVTTEL